MSWLSVSCSPYQNCHLAHSVTIMGHANTNSSEGNILPTSNAAPSLLSHQKSLERHMRRDSLEKQLQQRPPPEVLIQEGILEGMLNGPKSGVVMFLCNTRSGNADIIWSDGG